MRVSRVSTTVPLLAVAALLPATTAAQITSSVQARTDMIAPGDGQGWRGWSALGGAMALDRPRLSVTTDAAVVTDGADWDGRGALDAVVLTPSLGPLQLSANARAERSDSRDALRGWTAAVGARASIRVGQWGAWAGLDARRAPEADSLGERATPAIGGWRQFGRAIVSLSLAPRRFRVDGSAARVWQEIRTDSVFNDTIGGWEVVQYPVTVGDSGRAARHLRWDQAEARVFWSHGRLAADATVGGRMAGDFGRALWASVSGLYVLTPRVMLVAGAGSRPAEPASGWERRSFATLGVRLLGPPEPAHRPPPEIRPGASDFAIAPHRGGRYVLSLRVPHARTVEISGDFTEWKPVSLARVGPDRWEATVAIAPGTHYVNVRVNGDRWTAPPGIPEVEDEFNGTVGLLVVP